MSPGAGFTKLPLERTSFVKGGHFYSFGKATLKCSLTKPTQWIMHIDLIEGVNNLIASLVSPNLLTEILRQSLL